MKVEMITQNYRGPLSGHHLLPRPGSPTIWGMKRQSPEPALRLTVLVPYHHQLMLLEPVGLHTHSAGFLQGLHLCLLGEIIWKMTSLPGT